MTLLHYFGLAFLAFVATSLHWAPHADDGMGELWHWAIFACAFILGAQDRLQGIWKGLAIGSGVSSALAAVQWWYGHDWIILPTSDWGKPSGLFFSNAVAGAVAVMVLVGLASQRMWWWMLLPAPLLLLSQSRGAWLAGVVTWIICVMFHLAWKERFFFSLLWIAPVIVALMFFHTDSDGIRWGIWTQAVHSLSWLGAGIGSSQSIYLATPTNLFHIEHMHNDYLNLLYEFGLGALLLAPFLLLLEFRNAPDWPAYVCGLVLAVYSWPLESPVTGFILALVAGRLASRADVVWLNRLNRGLGFIQRDESRGLQANAGSRRAVPVFLGS